MQIPITYKKELVLIIKEFITSLLPHLCLLVDFFTIARANSATYLAKVYLELLQDLNFHQVYKRRYYRLSIIEEAAPFFDKAVPFITYFIELAFTPFIYFINIFT